MENRQPRTGEKGKRYQGYDVNKVMAQNSRHKGPWFWKVLGISLLITALIIGVAAGIAMRRRKQQTNYLSKINESNTVDALLDGHSNITVSQTYKGLKDMDIPIRHGEGRFITKDKATLDRIKALHLDTVIYNDRNPNGSECDIAGITDTTGRILGLMPHPEAFLTPENHPMWKRQEIKEAAGLALLKNGVDYINSRNIK